MLHNRNLATRATVRCRLMCCLLQQFNVCKTRSKIVEIAFYFDSTLR